MLQHNDPNRTSSVALVSDTCRRAKDENSTICVLVRVGGPVHVISNGPITWGIVKIMVLFWVP